MSYIFDGLQRSEAERSDVDTSGTLRVTELLERAERRAVSKWETSVRSDQHSKKDSVTPREPLTENKVSAITEVSDSSVESLQESERLMSLGQFESRQVRLNAQAHLPSLTDRGSPAAEAFRLLSVRLLHLRRERSLKKLLITSTIPQEGKSMIVANLACTLAMKAQQKVLVLEGDLRRPSLSQMFGLEKEAGLRECLEGGRNLETSVYHLAGPDIWVLPAGAAPSNALELLQSANLSKVMDELASFFDWIIIDSPPILPLADASVWMRLADGIILATRQGTTEKKKLKRGLEAIDQHKLLGALLNCSKTASASDYYYYGSPSGSA
jgi:capsular exopolysaccharide synthesis family protein